LSCVLHCSTFSPLLFSSVPSFLSLSLFLLSLSSFNSSPFLSPPFPSSPSLSLSLPSSPLPLPPSSTSLSLPLSHREITLSSACLDFGFTPNTHKSGKDKNNVNYNDDYGDNIDNDNYDNIVNQYTIFLSHVRLFTFLNFFCHSFYIRDFQRAK
jgi:hypothetical protein